MKDFVTLVTNQRHVFILIFEARVAEWYCQLFQA